MLVTSIFSFSHNVFYPSQHKSQFLSRNYAIVAFDNIVGKGENVGHKHFLLFPQCFLPFPTQISIFKLHL